MGKIKRRIDRLIGAAPARRRVVVLIYRFLSYTRHPPTEDVIAEQHEENEAADSSIDTDNGMAFKVRPKDLRENANDEPEKRQKQIHANTLAG